jgi:hypothetical protein
MEETAMEKTWETFWTSGKVTDYLTYRNGGTEEALRDTEQGQRKQVRHGTVRSSDGHGFDSHAYW